MAFLYLPCAFPVPSHSRPTANVASLQRLTDVSSLLPASTDGKVPYDKVRSAGCGVCLLASNVRHCIACDDEAAGLPSHPGVRPKAL